MGDSSTVDPPTIDNYVNGAFVPVLTGQYLDVRNPATDTVIAKVGNGGADDVEMAVAAAQHAFPAWSSWTIKARATVMLQLHGLLRDHADELARLIVAENGKNMTEALADVAKGNETVEYACSLPQLAAGNVLKVSGQVHCEDRRVPLGVVASIVPFNFPLMVPMWTTPIALVMGNTVVLKPSEKVPMTMARVATLMEQAGIPPGVFNLVQGGKDAVNALLAHPVVQAVTFVGSSPVAKLVAMACRRRNKRCTALGGAKNHLVALPDCDVEGTAADVVVSFAGCAGQRCMAASVLLLVGSTVEGILLDRIVEKAAAIKSGHGPSQMGPVIDKASYDKIVGYIEAAETDGAKVLLDGRGWKNHNRGNWIGPTIILHSKSTDRTMCDEVFGPVLSVYVCSTWEEAVAIENASPFGNAASIYTTNAAHAEWFHCRFRAAMLGTNIGIPVPREPFSFGGLYGTCSKYGDQDITGSGGMEFFSNRIKITTKWPSLQRDPNTPNGNKKQKTEANDAANFAGTM